MVRLTPAPGTLIVVRTAVASGETRIKLHRGIYIVTFNDGVGREVIIR
jgi:hypothetical protein